MEPKNNEKINEQMKAAREQLIVGLHAREAGAEGAPEAEDDKYFHIEGEPIVLGQETVLIKKGAWGMFDGEEFPDKDIVEIIDKNALKECDISDVVLNVNHGDGNHAVARTRNKTITFEEKEDGLYMDAKLSKENERCVQFYKDVREGLLDRMSFAFTIPADGEEFAEEEDRYVSTITKIDRIYDVSAVEFPAYGQTSISSKGRSQVLRSKTEAAAGARYFQQRKQALIDKASEIVSRCAPKGE